MAISFSSTELVHLRMLGHKPFREQAENSSRRYSKYFSLAELSARLAEWVDCLPPVVKPREAEDILSDNNASSTNALNKHPMVWRNGNILSSNKNDEGQGCFAPSQSWTTQHWRCLRNGQLVQGHATYCTVDPRPASCGNRAAGIWSAALHPVGSLGTMRACCSACYWTKRSHGEESTRTCSVSAHFGKVV